MIFSKNSFIGIFVPMKIAKKQICSNLPDVKFYAACKKPEFTLRAEGDGEGCLPEVYTNTK